MNTIDRLSSVAALAAILLTSASECLSQQGSGAPATPEVNTGVPPAIETAIEQSARVVGHSVQTSESGGTVTFDLADGERLRLALSGGRIRLNNETIGRYEVGGPLAQAWTGMLTDVQGLSSVEVLDAVQAWPWDFPENVVQVDVQAIVEAALTSVGMAEAQVAAIGTSDVPAVAVAPRVNAVPDVAVPIADVPVQAQAIESTSVLGSMAGNALSLLASLVALTFIGFGYLFFAPRQLGSVADTAWHSFGRSFLTGLFAQPLLVPVFGAMIVGLALTVVGLLVIPFAIPAFLATLLLAVTGGYIALARSVGEIYIRRKGSVDYEQPGWMELKYVFFGLLGLLSIWLPAALLSWVPVAGPLLTLLAALLTWVLATAGFGATILTRGGNRGTIVRRLDYALTDQRLWDTTPGITNAADWKSRSSA